MRKALAAEAKAKGICAEWYEKILTAPSKEYLLTLAVKGSDFWLGNAFDNPRIREEFNGLRQRFGIFVDEDEIAAQSPRTVIATDRAHGSARYGNFDVGDIILSGNARLTLTATGNAFVCVAVYDRAEVDAKASEDARISIIRHGGECRTQTEGRAKIKITDNRTN